MFLKNHDDDSDDELGGGDLVVPLSLVASTPQVINGATSRPGTASMGTSSDGPSEGSGRSLQYNERLARARALNEQKRKVSSNAERRACLLYTSPSPRDGLLSRMPSSA